MSTRQRPDLYGGGAGRSSQLPYHARAATPPTGPPYYPQQQKTSAKHVEQKERDAKRHIALQGVPKLAERASARPIETVRLTEEEMKANKERADIFSLIVMADRLERAWIDDIIPNNEYEAACTKLIQQFNVVRKNSQSVPDLKKFSEEYHCNAAHGMQMGFSRLLTGMPATMEHGMIPTARRNYEGRAKRIHDCTEAFIALLDAIEIGNTTAEQLAPLARELLKSLGKVEGLESGFKFKALCQGWVEKIGAMSAYATLADEELANFRMQALAGYDDYSDALLML